MQTFPRQNKSTDFNVILLLQLCNLAESNPNPVSISSLCNICYCFNPFYLSSRSSVRLMNHEAMWVQLSWGNRMIYRTGCYTLERLPGSNKNHEQQHEELTSTPMWEKMMKYDVNLVVNKSVCDTYGSGQQTSDSLFARAAIKRLFAL